MRPPALPPTAQPLAAWHSACCLSGGTVDISSRPLPLLPQPWCHLPGLSCRTEFPRPPWAQGQSCWFPPKPGKWFLQPKLHRACPGNSPALLAAGT